MGSVVSEVSRVINKMAPCVESSRVARIAAASAVVNYTFASKGAGLNSVVRDSDSELRI